ncbi:MAG: SulP family inorganic anion transporter [Myxococcales bacterium]|nr:SulP family inorganic anion transporter [Myxococcales bacterium]
MIALSRWLPLLDLRSWRAVDLPADLRAAAAVTVLSVPQGLAYAMLAGLPPVVGLYASIWPALFGALFRSSRHVVAGPTNALSLLVGTAVASVAASTGASALTLAVTLALTVGAIQILAGLLRLGMLVDYISNSVVLGYITGAAVLIAAGQLANLTRTPMEGVDLGTRLVSWAGGASGADGITLALGGATVALLLLLRRLDPRIPGPLVAMVFGVAMCVGFGLHAGGLRILEDLAPIGGAVLHWSRPELQWVGALLPAAVAATVLSLVEASSVGRSIAGRSGDRLDASVEFVGQGLANAAAAFTSGYPVSGSLSRSMTNWRTGGRSRLAGVFGAAMVAGVVLLAGPLVNQTPLATLAGILLVLASDLIDWARIRMTLKGGWGDGLAFAVTLIGAWVLRLDQAIYLGVALSIVLFLRRARMLTVTELVVDDDDHLRERAEDDEMGGRHCAAVRVLHVEGSLFFGAASELSESLDQVVGHPELRVLVLRLKRCHGLDVTTADVLRALVATMRRSGREVVLVGMRPDVMARMAALGLVEAFGAQNLFPTERGWFVAMDRALDRALDLVGEHEPACPLHAYRRERAG